ncbi:MAG: iron-sulfur cluster assembly scaffold protein [Candidatus Woesearchaeota archaeon]
MNYNQNVMNLFKNPKHSGVMKNPDGIGEVGNVRCGDIMKVMIKVKKNRITEVKFQTFGCVAAIASSEALSELVEGKTLEEAEQITNRKIVHLLGELPPVKMHCSVLGEEALKAAITDYMKKHKKTEKKAKAKPKNAKKKTKSSRKK